MEELNKRLRKVMARMGYKDLTEIQEMSIPKILTGRHTLIVAPTGSGKTEAALFPIISMMLDRWDDPPKISAIYVTPLRALNRDLLRRIEKLCASLGLKVMIRHGDTPSYSRRLMISKPPHILITTPETLANVLVHDGMRKHLKNVRWVVVDEFHELMGSKRGAELIANLERLLNISGGFQRIALSASIGNINLAKEMLAYGRIVDDVIIPYVREMDIKVFIPGTCPDTSNVCDKVEVVADLINKHRVVLIFSNTRDEAEWLGARLSGLGINVYVHHGSLSRSEREKVEKELKEGSVQAVVATSSLELGIDVGHIDSVIQSSSPRQASKLIQRIGRSYHREGLKAKGYVVTDRSFDDIIESVVIARRASGGDIETPKPYERSFDVLTHVLAGMGLEGNGFTIDDSLETLRRSYPFRRLTPEDLMKTIEFMSDIGLLRFKDMRFRTTGKGRIYYLTTTMIVDTSYFTVVNVASRKFIGKLDEEFVALALREDSTIILGGRVWRVVGVDNESKKIYVTESTTEEALIPTWSGETIPVDYKVAREVCALRKIIALKHIPYRYLRFLPEESIKMVENVIATHIRKGYPLPTDNNLVVEVIPGKRTLLVAHVCLGTKGNRALSYVLIYPFSSYLGIDPLVKVDPYRVYVELPYQLSMGIVNRLLGETMMRSDIYEVFRRSIRRSALYKLVAFKVLKRMGLIPKEAPANVIKTLVNRFMDKEIINAEIVNEVLTRYVDMDALSDLLERLRKGRAKLTIVEVSAPSPLAAEGLRIGGGYDRVKVSSMPKHMVAELIKRRLIAKNVRLVCMVCGNSWVSKVSELPQWVSCPKCDVRLVGVARGLDEGVINVVKKGIKAGGRYKFVLTDEEKKLFEHLMKTANLVLIYGKKAVIALMAYGVGPETAKRALAINDEVEFYSKLYELEKLFIRTRKYWD